MQHVLEAKNMHKDVNLATVSVMPDTRRHATAPQTAWTSSIIASAVLLILSITATLAQQPRIMLEVPGTSPDMLEVCLQQDSLVDIFDLGGDVILSAVAAREDLGCPAPPGANPVINNFVVSTVPVDPLDIDGTVNTFLDTSSANCDPDQDPLTEDICLFVTWDVTPSVSPDVICQISQTGGLSSMTPTTFFNPGSFINSASEFVAFRVNQVWPATDISNGNRSYRMTCGNDLKNVASIVSPERLITFGDGVAGVEIVSFQITQDSAVQGSNINFNWQINSVGGAAINCTMSSDTNGVINDVSITTASGNSFAQILPDAALGGQGFTLNCQNLIGPTGTDTVTITESAGDQCPPQPPGRDTRETLFTQVFGSLWPGNNGNVDDINVRRNQYKALRFTANTGAGIRDSDTLTWFKPTSGGSNQSPAQVSITPCPGDFAPEDANCEVTTQFINGNLPWAIDTGSTTGACALTPSATYYLNVRYPQCTATTCADAFEL